jgi:hypothetical protein
VPQGTPVRGNRGTPALTRRRRRSPTASRNLINDEAHALFPRAVALVGERNGEISLHTMSEKQEGSASKEKQPPPQFVVAAIELVLKVSAG